MEMNFHLSKKEEEHVALIQKLNAMFNVQNYDIDDLFTSDYVDHNKGWHVASVEDLKKVIADGHKNFDVHNEIKRIIPSGDMLFIEVQNHGVHKTEVFGQSPTGKKTKMTTFEIYRFKEGKIAERWVVSDIVGLMKQVGVSTPLSQ